MAYWAATHPSPHRTGPDLVPGRMGRSGLNRFLTTHRMMGIREV